MSNAMWATKPFDLANFKAEIREVGGFITKDQLAVLKQHERLHPVLVRCGGGRFTCPAQDVDHFIDVITKEGSDYVRDVSIPVVY